MYLWSDFTGFYGDFIYILQIAKLIMLKDSLSSVCRDFYADYIHNCVSNDKVDCLISHIVEKATKFDTFSLNCIDHRGIFEFKIDFSDDVYSFLTHDFFLMKNGHIENDDIHKLLNDITSGYYFDTLDYSISTAAENGVISYGSIENRSLYIGPFFIEETIEMLAKLDHLITVRRYLFKLKGYHQKTHQQMVGFSYY